jgi:quercetin dioxygenase-like cupin family protein
MKNDTGIITKAWGHELIHFSIDFYCMKELCFSKAGNKFSMHFHKTKTESWLVTKGSFKLRVIHTKDASVTQKVLQVGETWTNEPLQPHQLIALADESVMLEVSTMDDADDNYRIFAGDSQPASPLIGKKFKKCHFGK